VGWLLIKKHPDIVTAGKKLTFDDLANDATVTFQKKTDPWFAFFMCFVFPGLVCTLWGDSFWNGFWVAGSLRYVFLLHCTWLVNSAAHLYGDHPYDPKS
jgi:stearoyl-CoA desaturase (delta-9 desaturase)